MFIPIHSSILVFTLFPCSKKDVRNVGVADRFAACSLNARGGRKTYSQRGCKNDGGQLAELAIHGFVYVSSFSFFFVFVRLRIAGLYTVQKLQCGDWDFMLLRTGRCIIRLGPTSVKILHYAAIVCLLVCCMFACGFLVCLCVVWLLCGDGVCCTVRNSEMATIESVLSGPDAVLFDWVLLCKNPTLCSNCVFACVLYVCLCVCLCVCMVAMR